MAFTYNGVDLSGDSLKADVSCELVKDEAGRVNIYHRYTLSAQFVVQDDGGTDADLAEIRRKLTTSGAPLVYDGFGFDALTTNTPTTTNVALFCGPHPEVVSWKPIGASRAAEVEWKVVVCLQCPCSQGPLAREGILAYNYSANFGINERGWTTRTIAGYIQIIVARLTPSQNISDCADRYREQVALAAPAGFQRIQNQWNVDASKSRLDFLIVDKQVESPNAYPPHVVAISADHSVEWNEHQRGMLFNTLNMDVELKPDHHRAEAYKMFLQMALARMSAARQGERFPWIQSVRLQEQIFGYRNSFSIRWRVLGCLEDLLAPSGLFTATGNDWNQWRISMASVWGQRGYAGLQVAPGNDLLVTICGSPGILLPDQPVAFANPAYLPSEVLKNQQPPAQYSWLAYEMGVSPSREVPVVRQSPLQQPQQLNSQGSMDDTGGPLYEAIGNGIADILQKSGLPRYSFILSGRAQRAGHKIPRPVLSALGGVPLEEVKSHFEQTAKMVLGQVCYSAAWAIKYVMASSPGSVPAANDKESDPCKRIADTILQ